MYAVQRLTFGSRNLLAGIDMIPVLIGLFAVTEVFKQTDPKKKRLLRRIRRFRRQGQHEDAFPQGNPGRSSGRCCAAPSSARSSAFCRSAGATIASFMCYTMETKISKHPEKFGTGIIDGIAASEASNNAATGGAMVPLLSSVFRAATPRRS